MRRQEELERKRREKAEGAAKASVAKAGAGGEEEDDDGEGFRPMVNVDKRRGSRAFLANDMKNDMKRADARSRAVSRAPSVTHSVDTSIEDMPNQLRPFTSQVRGRAAALPSPRTHLLFPSLSKSHQAAHSPHLTLDPPPGARPRRQPPRR